MHRSRTGHVFVDGMLPAFLPFGNLALVGDHRVSEKLIISLEQLELAEQNTIDGVSGLQLTAARRMLKERPLR